MTTKSAEEEPVSNAGSFLFIGCNPRSQNLCKQEIKQAYPALSPSFSRPGFLTYKVNQTFSERFDLSLTFARTFGWSLQPTQPPSLSELVSEIISAAEQHKAPHVHVWARDWVDHSLEEKSESQQAIETLLGELQKQKSKLKINAVTRADERVLDVIWGDTDRWWLGWHIAGSIPQRWPGGVPPIQPPESMISRAYLKTREALLWSGIPVNKGTVCAEIGSAPGGSCQRLLELGAQVIAIDPADLAPAISKHANVTHLKMRGRDVPHRALSEVSLLLADSNVAPTHTLDTVEELVSGKQTHFRGLILTLKFTDPKMAREIDVFIQRIKSWGFRFVKTRQLAYGRQEICVMALKQKSARRFSS